VVFATEFESAPFNFQVLRLVWKDLACNKVKANILEVEMPVLDTVLGKTLPFNVHWQLVKRTPRIALSKHQSDTFWKQGHLSIPKFIDPAEVDEIERIFRHLFDVRAGWKEGHFYDMAGSEQNGDFKLPQMLHLTKYAPELLRTVFWANADALAKGLLGPTAHFSFDHGINKPVRPDSQTPWHQDQAFHAVGSRIENITIWLPLQDVTPDNGCLKFIPGSHLTGMVKHRNYQNDSRIEGLEAIDVNNAEAVFAPCPKAASRSTTAARCTPQAPTCRAAPARSTRSSSRWRWTTWWCRSNTNGTATNPPPASSASRPTTTN
jgi:phytanoyl-CoA hydroxylase